MLSMYGFLCMCARSRALSLAHWLQLIYYNKWKTMHHKPKMTITHSLVDFDATFHTRTHENVWNNHWTCINNFSLLSRLNQGHFGIEKTRHCLPTHQYPNWKRSAIKIISVECFMIIKIARIRVHDEWTFRFDCRTAALVLETWGVCCCFFRAWCKSWFSTHRCNLCCLLQYIYSFKNAVFIVV